MELFDTHTHLESFARRGDLPAVLERARQAGVATMVTIGTGPDDWELYRGLVAQHAADGFVRHTVGLHPCSVDSAWEAAVAGIEARWKLEPRPVALGECGLDRFHLPKEPGEAARIFAWQQAAFAAQLAIARRLDAPVVVHSRGAFAECVAMIDASGVAPVLVPPDKARYSREHVGSEYIGWLHFQPVYERLVQTQGDMFD